LQAADDTLGHVFDPVGQCYAHMLMSGVM